MDSHPQIPSDGVNQSDISTPIKTTVDGPVTNADAVMSSDKTVTKRNGETQTLVIDKIRTRLERLLEGLASKHIDLSIIINKTVAYAQNGKYRYLTKV